MDQEIIFFGGFRLDPHKRTLERSGEGIVLTDTEFNLLQMILELTLKANGGAVKKSEIIAKVWADNPSISPNALPTHLINLRVKLSDAAQTLIQPRGRTHLLVATEVRRQPRASAGFPVLPGRGSVGLKHNDSPYVGPEPFPRTKPSLFFGRDEEVSQLVDLVTAQASRVVLLYGPSGAGKTSLVNAALTRALTDLNYTVFPAARVGVQPQLYGRAQPKNFYTFSALCSMQTEQAGNEDLMSLTLDTFVKSKSEAGKRGTVLIVDQLEEILSPGLCPPSHIVGFFAELHAAVVRNPTLRVVLVFREEFLGPLRRLGRELNYYWREYVLSELACSKAVIAIRKPAQALGVEFEQELAEMLVDELSKGKHVLYDGRIIDEKKDSVEPLHLQLVCTALWNRLPEALLSITFDCVEPILHDLIPPRSESPESVSPERLIATFVLSVLQTFCDDAVKSAVSSERTKHGGKFPPELIDLGCLQFITERRTRTPPIRQGPEWTGDLPNWVIEELGRHHMLRMEEHGTERAWELSHDAWIQPVLRRGTGIDKSVLRQLYLRITKGIAEGESARTERFDEAAIHLGCLAFVEGQQDRLPRPILEALANDGLLRRNGKGEFELSHRALGPAIAEVRLQGDFDTRLAALKGLKVYVERSLTLNGGSWTDWFEDYDPVLKSLNRDITWPILYESEAHFILRASFATGYELGHWLRQMNHRYPAISATVLKEAAHHVQDDRVRRRAAENLPLLGSPESGKTLVELAIFDLSESVRQAAGAGLANPDQAECWNAILAHCTGPRRKQAFDALAWAWEIRVRSSRQEEFETWLRDRLRSIKIRTYLERTRIRLTATFGRLALLSLVASLACGTMTALTRMVPGRVFGTLSQNSGDFAFHWFNGLIGGGVWGASIPGVMLIWLYVFVGPKLMRPGSARLNAAIAGGMGGFLGGMLNDVIMLAGVSKEWLHTAAWLPTLESHSVEAFTTSRFGFGYVVFGVMLGIGVGCSFHSILMKSLSTDVANDRATLEHFEDLPRLVRHSLRRCVGRSSWIAISMAIGAIVFATVLHPTDLHLFLVSRDPVRWRILGEAVSIYLGGLGLITGLYFGLVLLKKGIRIEGRDDFAMLGGEIDETPSREETPRD